MEGVMKKQRGGEHRHDHGFAAFAAMAEPRLRRAFLAQRGVHGAADATAEALACAWERWPRVQAMENPVGYLYRVGLPRTRVRMHTRVLALPTSEALTSSLRRTAAGSSQAPSVASEP
jgi:predicted RNA polymerase sigma factor